MLGVAFSPDGTLLATVDAHGTVRLWNPATGQPVGAPLPSDRGADGAMAGVAFSPDGTLLASADSGGIMRLWDESPFANPYAVLCTDVGPLARQTWDQYASGEPIPKICA